MDERRVVPIVGPDAAIVDGPDGAEPFTAVVARRVAELLELEPANGRATLHDVACRWLSLAGPRRMAEVYGAVRLVLDEQPIAIPEPLRVVVRQGHRRPARDWSIERLFLESRPPNPER